MCDILFFFFFFQAEDGIRDKLVTGVQTCALPIFGLRRASWSDPWGLTILTGAAFGTVMLANVWRVIWPNQKIVIANAVAIAGGGQANPAAAGAARRAFLASRTNVVLSFPMLFLMGAASHFTLPASGNRGLWAVILLVILALLEVNALVGTTGPTKKPIETVRGVIVTGVVRSEEHTSELQSLAYLVCRL